MPASKETRYLTASTPADGEIRIPIATATGAAEGPTLVVVAGVHGSEYVGIEATKRLFRWIHAEQLRGTVVTVPCLNLPAFYGLAAHVNPVDGRDLIVIAVERGPARGWVAVGRVGIEEMDP